MFTKKLGIMAFLCCLTVSSLSFAMTGSGSSGDPWVIASRADFDAYCASPAYWGGSVRLDTDLDLSGTTYDQAPIAPDTVHNAFSFNGTAFTGKFDGNGHKISGLTINSYNKDFVALIGKIDHGAVVEKLGIENCYIKADSSSNNWNTGAITGDNSGTIRYCYATGKISAADETGGLCGVSTGVIENSYSLVRCNATGYFGGLCGWMMSGSITNCYSAGEVGYVGSDAGLIDYYSNGTITSSYWDIKMSRCETSGGETGYGGTGLTNDQMRTQASFTAGGWDFVGESTNGTSDIWKMSHASGSTNGYPMLWWQTDNPDASLAGSGISTNPFIIASRANFDAFCANPNYWDDCIRLNVDIDLAGTTFTKAPIAPDTVTGTSSYVEDFEGVPFAGVFEGNGHNISGLTIVGGNNCHLGLFGCIRLGDVKNLTVSQCNISGNLRNIGGLCGAKRLGTIANCSVTGTISGGAAESVNIGGLCGHLRSAGGIFNCTADVAVSGRYRVGGLIGEHYGDGVGKVVNCSSRGTVTGTGGIGGLCGGNSADITNSFSEATVTGEDNLGGFCGGSAGGGPFNLTVSGCFATGNVTGTGENIAGFTGVNQGIMKDCYATGNVTGGTDVVAGFCGQNWNAQLIRCYSTGQVIAMPGTQIQAGFCAVNSTAPGFSGSIKDCFWNTQTSGMESGYMSYDSGLGMYVGRPSESGVCVGISTAQMQQQTTFTAAGWDFSGETANGTEDIWEMPLTGINNNYPMFTWLSDTTISGSGTSTDPYIISSRAKFNLYASKPVYWNGYARLECNLDLSDTVYTAAPIAPDTNDTLVDFQGTTFTGNFNGNWYHISGLKINGGTGDYLGLFGRVGVGGAVKNLILKNDSVSGYDYIGSLCGDNVGTIDKCSVYGQVNAGTKSGGLAGRNMGTISQCAAKCTVNGADYTGGLVGFNEVGGQILNSYALGDCHTSDVYTGGLVGLNDGSVINCYANCLIDANESPNGAFCGYTNGGGTVSGSYYDKAYGNDSYAIGRTTAQFIVRTTFSGWDFTGSATDGRNDYWHMPYWTNQSRPILNWQIDLKEIFERWLSNYRLCDLNGDQIVNLEDFVIHTTE